MGKLITKIKSSKIMNKGVIKKVKDKIYFKFISPREEKKTDKYRTEIINKVYKIFDGCTWQLFAGSFLRFYRDKTMEGQDLDFYILREDFEKVKDKFFEEGFSIQQIFVSDEKKITEYKFLYKDVSIDVFMIDKKKKSYIHRFTMEYGDKYTKEVIGNTQIITGKDIIGFEKVLGDFTNTKEYEYKGAKFFGFAEPEEALYLAYGKNWTFYDPSYDPRKDPDNNKPIQHPNATVYAYIKPLTSYDQLFSDVKNS